MTTQDIFACPDLLFDGATLRPGMALRLQQGRVTDLCPVSSLGTAPRSPIRGTLTPGFIDLQVNGGGNVLLNTTPTAAGMAAIAAAHRRFGTIGVLPTVITDASEVLDRAVDAALATKGQPGLLGLHIEGPHLAPARRGTHAAQFLHPVSDRTVAQIHRLRAAGVAVMVTLAPEAASLAQIASLAATGAIVSLGHSDATAEATRAALTAGATCFTHLYNAMSPMQSRAPGVTGAAILSTAHAGIICDGHHVADDMIALAIRARPLPNRMFLISDAMPTVGGSDRFRLYDAEICLVDGKLVNAEGNLAGAHLTMADALHRVITTVGIAPDAALRMATTIPARLIGAATGVLDRPARDLLILDAGWRVAGYLS